MSLKDLYCFYRFWVFQRFELCDKKFANTSGHDRDTMARRHAFFSLATKIEVQVCCCFKMGLLECLCFATFVFMHFFNFMQASRNPSWRAYGVWKPQRVSWLTTDSWGQCKFCFKCLRNNHRNIIVSRWCPDGVPMSGHTQSLKFIGLVAHDTFAIPFAKQNML